MRYPAGIAIAFVCTLMPGASRAREILAMPPDPGEASMVDFEPVFLATFPVQLESQGHARDIHVAIAQRRRAE